MKLILQRRRVVETEFFATTQIAVVLIAFTCLVNLGECQLFPQYSNYDYHDHHGGHGQAHHGHGQGHHGHGYDVGVNLHTHHHHQAPVMHSLPVNPFRQYQYHQRPRHVIKKHHWISGTFYNKLNYRGRPLSYFFGGTSCVDFPTHQRMASLKPFGCIMLFKHQHCKGPVSMVFENMPNLNVVGMSDGIASIKNCFTDEFRSKHMRFPSYKKK